MVAGFHSRDEILMCSLMFWHTYEILLKTSNIFSKYHKYPDVNVMLFVIISPRSVTEWTKTDRIEVNLEVAVVDVFK